MSAHPSQFIFQPERVAQNRDRAADLFFEHAFLQRHLSTQFLERLEDVSRHFDLVLDYGAHTGLFSKELAASSQTSDIVSVEMSSRMAALGSADGVKMATTEFERLPFANATFDLVASLSTLHWVNDLPQTLLALRQLLKPDGLFMAGLFGGGTLAELRSALMSAESEIRGGISPRVSPLLRLQDAAMLLQRTGFALPVADIQTVTVRYSHPMKVLMDLKGMGQQAAFARHAGQARYGLSRRLLHRMCDVYQEQFSDPDGKVRATYEVIWLSGWAPAPGQPQPLQPGSATHSLAEAIRGAGDKK